MGVSAYAHLILINGNKYMKLQVAIDYTDLLQAKRTILEIAEVVDIIEIGTPLLLSAGKEIICWSKKHFPNLCVLADAKIVDGGEAEAAMLFDSGADIVTVIADANDSTIRKVVSECKKNGNKCMADLIITRDSIKRAEEINKLGVDYLCVHTAFDIQADVATPFEELLQIKKSLPKASTAIAGGINLQNIQYVAAANPDIIIVGGCICNSSDKVSTIMQIKEAMRRYGG
ncbi:MAG: orotidine 5'-phosphate decarboxylase [Oscillospiraceae bacterium]|nr:orotidine 5'-phosphate decarboxylase [Oscillospiraceae bacterium]